jgi:hypothetical protein
MTKEKGSMVINDIIITYLLRKISKKAGQIISSFEAEPDNPRIEFYLVGKKSAETIFAVTIYKEVKMFEIYPLAKVVNVRLSDDLRHLFSLLGFQILERKKI